jgi:hypothetical protein
MNCNFSNFGGAYILANIGVPIKIKGALNSSYHGECFHKKLKELEF